MQPKFDILNSHAPIGQPYTPGDIYSVTENNMKKYQQDLVLLVPTYHDCTADKFTCTYKDARTAQMKLPNGSTFENSGVWIASFLLETKTVLRRCNNQLLEQVRRPTSCTTSNLVKT